MNKKHILYLFSFILFFSCGDLKESRRIWQDKHTQKIVKTVIQEIDKELNKESKSKKIEAVSDTGSTVNRVLLPAKITQKPEQLMYKTAYVVSYNSETKTPNYVAWLLTAAHTKGKFKRNGNAFQPDPEVKGVQVTTFDYVRSGYDRGHMCPSADNKWSERAQQESFLMTNICPQAPNLNSGDWSELEQMCRSWARKWGEIHIVCGPINPQENGRRIGPNKVLVPKGFFKVVLYNGSSPKAIGFIYPNDDTDKPLKAYATSVDEMERITGFNFFASLDDKIENEIEKNYNFKDWDTSN